MFARYIRWGAAGYVLLVSTACMVLCSCGKAPPIDSRYIDKSPVGQPEMTVTIDKLFSDLTIMPDTALREYDGKILSVDGEVSEAQRDGLWAYVKLEGERNGYVWCILDSNSLDMASNLKVGERVRAIGQGNMRTMRGDKAREEPEMLRCHIIRLGENGQ